MLKQGHSPEIKRYITGTCYIFGKLIAVIRDDGYFTTIRVPTKAYGVKYCNKYFSKMPIEIVKWGNKWQENQLTNLIWSLFVLFVRAPKIPILSYIRIISRHLSSMSFVLGAIIHITR